jgi:hypothetical protein
MIAKEHSEYAANLSGTLVDPFIPCSSQTNLSPHILEYTKDIVQYNYKPTFIEFELKKDIASRYYGQYSDYFAKVLPEFGYQPADILQVQTAFKNSVQLCIAS